MKEFYTEGIACVKHIALIAIATALSLILEDELVFVSVRPTAANPKHMAPAATITLFFQFQAEDVEIDVAATTFGGTASLLLTTESSPTLSTEC